MRNHTKLTDEQLICSYAAGDNVAFDTLLLRHKDWLYNYIYQMVHDSDVATISSRRLSSRLSPPCVRAVIRIWANFRRG